MGGCIVWSGNRIEIPAAAGSLREIIKGNTVEIYVEFPTLNKELSTVAD